MEFEAFPKIKRFKGLRLSITQKIHGSNAQIYIQEVPIPGYAERDKYPVIYRLDKKEILNQKTCFEIDDKVYRLYCGSRTRWITPEEDNFGFANYIYSNAKAFIKYFGVGRHFGEWAGPGINAGEGLIEKTFVLFDYWKFPPERVLPPRCIVVPVLYDGKADLDKITEVFDKLKAEGSSLVPGYMKPEGIVITLNGERYKKVFTPEEVAWQNQKIKKNYGPRPDYGYLLQPIRLEKLLSRDEKYLKGYPETLGLITKDYIIDLKEEDQLTEVMYEQLDTKELSRQVFPFVRSLMEEIFFNAILENQKNFGNL